MRITGITIENFKGIRDPATIQLRPVTLLFGANSAGKSTIVQALQYAHELLERHNVDPGKTLVGGEAVELGGFETIVHGHDRSKVVQLRLDMALESDEELPTYRLPYVTSYSEIEVAPTKALVSAWIELHVAWSERLERPVLERYEVGLNGELFATIEASRDLSNVSVSLYAFAHSAFLKEPESPDDDLQCDLFDLASEVLAAKQWSLKGEETVHFGILSEQDAVPQFGRPLDIQEEAFASNVESPSRREFVEMISHFIVGPGELARNALRSLCYVGPLRQVPPRNFEAIRSPDESRWAVGLGAWDILAKADDSLVERVNEWLTQSNRLDAGYRIEVKRYKELELNSPLLHALRARRALDEDEDILGELEAAPTRTRLVLRDETTGIEVLPQDVGVGLSQLIPVIVAALHKPGIVAIEQPELHIHPRWQVVLGDLFLSQERDAGGTFLIETHSEHLVLRVMRRMRETFMKNVPPGAPSASPEDVAIYFIEVDQDQTIAREMPLNEAGELVKAWPGGFFEEGLREQIGDA